MEKGFAPDACRHIPQSSHWNGQLGEAFSRLSFSILWSRVFVLSGMCPLSGMVLHPKGRMIRNSPCTSVNRDSVVSRVKFEIPITLPLPKRS